MSDFPWHLFHYAALGSLASLNTPYPYNTAGPLTVAALTLVYPLSETERQHRRSER